MAKKKDVDSNKDIPLSPLDLGEKKVIVRTAKGTFAKGYSGGPGRPKKESKRQQLIDEVIGVDGIRELLRITFENAKNGDKDEKNFLLSYCLSKPAPEAAPTPEPIYFDDTFDLGPTETPDQMMKAISRLREACSKGEISKEYSSYMESSMLATYKVYEASELMPTLKALQEYIKKAGKK